MDRYREKNPAKSWTELRRPAPTPQPGQPLQPPASASEEDSEDDEGPKPTGSPTYADYEKRQRMLNQNQVLAAAHFVRRLKAFMRHLIQYPPLLGGKLTDYIIRYETQGRGSVHAHMLWWIKMDPKYIPESDVIKLDPDLLLRFGLAVKKCERGEQAAEVFMATTDPPATQPCEEDSDASGSESDGPERSESPPPTQPAADDLVKLYNEDYLTYTNANIWALKNPENLRAKLHIGLPPIESLP